MQTRASPSRTHLTSLAAAAGVPRQDAGRMSKAALFERLRNYNLDRLQRQRNRNAKRVAPADASPRSPRPPKRRLVTPAPAPAPPTNLEDPITRTAFAAGAPTFVFVRPNGTSIRYDASTLARYVLGSGDFAEPESRVPFSEEDLRCLDEAAGLQQRTVELFRHPERLQAQKERRTQVVGLERCCSDLVVEMVNIVETYEREEGECQLLMACLPSFADLYRQLHALDAEGARLAMRHYRLFCRGPPNKRTADPNGLLGDVLLFLDSVADGSGSAADYGY